MATAGLLRFLERGLRPLARVVTDAGLVFLLVGAAWVFADSLGYRPLDFPAVSTARGRSRIRAGGAES